MIADHLKQKRLLVPRWRSLSVTLCAKELASATNTMEPDSQDTRSREVEEKLAQWRDSPGVITAGELVGAAIVSGQEGRADSAASFIVSDQSTATKTLKRLAQDALDRTRGTASVHPGDTKVAWRARTRLYPHNALAWVELALWDLIDRKKTKALRNMLVALDLAPNDRHVLRSACRLFLHLNDPERAYGVIERNAATIHDPWLMAAELSVAELANRRPKYVRHGRRIVRDGGLHPRQTTELAGAIATLEMTGGRVKRARDYFDRSVLDPTGSALAQAEWASAELGVELVSRRRLKHTTERDEAVVFHLLREERFREVPDVCMKWAGCEPYAIRPFEIASSATSVVGAYEDTLKLAQKGLRLRPRAPMLLNNCAFALAHLGQSEEAEKALRLVQTDNPVVELVTEANRGLLAMRKGDITTGLNHYRLAISGFVTLNEPKAADLARIYRAREAAIAGADEARSMFEIGKHACDRLNGKVYRHVIRDAEVALARSR